MTKQINVQPPSLAIVDRQGRPTIEFFSLIAQLAALEILDGDGDPNGVIFAKFKTLYFDAVGNQLYIKTTGPGVNTGWFGL